MKKLAQLRARRKELADSVIAIDKAACIGTDDEREYTAEEKATLEAAGEEIETLSAEIAELERIERTRQQVQQLAKPNPRRTQPDSSVSSIDVAENTSITGGEAVIMQDENRGFSGLGDFASAVYRSDPHIGQGFVDERLEAVAAASGMSQGVGSDGGNLVPPAFSTQIWDKMNESTDNLLDRADNYTVEGESLTFPANAETSRANGSRYGGIRGYWLGEAEQMTASKPKTRQMKLEPQELGVLVYVTDKLLKNSTVALQQYLTRAAADEINFMVGDAIINGDGAAKPLGILNSGAAVAVAKETSQAADTLLAANINKMWARLHARCRANAVWFINQDVEPQFDTLNTPVKNVAGSENVGGFASRIYDAEKNTLKGRPIVPIEYCPTIGDKGDIILADMTGYAVGTRGGIDTAMSMHLRFDYNETAFRFLFAVDGQPWLKSPITPYKGTNTLSSFVVLNAR